MIIGVKVPFTLQSPAELGKKQDCNWGVFQISLFHVVCILYFVTFEQLAIATRSSTAWLNNARRLLGRRMHRTPSGARWWGLVRMLNHEVGIPLKNSARAADLILGGETSTHRVRIAASDDGSAGLYVDLERFHSTANAALSAAFIFAPLRKRGRPKRSRAQKPKAFEFSPVWEIRVQAELEALTRLAHHLREWDAYPRGIELGLPFIMDVETLQALPRLALSSAKGSIDVILEPRDPVDI
jgi:hypothetical protein